MGHHWLISDVGKGGENKHHFSFSPSVNREIIEVINTNQ